MAPTAPRFAERSAQLVEVLRRKSPRELSRLMDISDALATLNAQRYRDWSPQSTPHNARAAVFAFDGDVYDGLRGRELPAADLEWAQRHLRILSGLYGVLRPLDLLQPYRLEMGTALRAGRARNLYEFWGGAIAQSLNEDLQADATPVVVNLASQEYFRSVDRQVLRARVVECVFEEARAGSYKVVSFFAKKARGTFARWAIRERVELPSRLPGFAEDGYRFAPDASTPGRLVFRRTMQS